MTGLPRVEIPQLDLPGVWDTQTRLTLHPVTHWNYTQRITIARLGPKQIKWRFADMYVTRAQVLEVIDHLIDRVDIMTDTIPGGRP